jgi:phosphatidylserine/phosphatidylglycerophosphate/cardiolipin synthase-like enzyme
MAGLEVFTLTDGGQSADDVAKRVAAFIEPAQRTLEIALYDVRLPDPTGSIVADAIRAAGSRGVKTRLIYNVDVGKSKAIHPPPATRPEVLNELPIEIRAVSGIPDLMHHKYVVRDGAAVWTGSANWTIDSWTRQEAVLAIAESPELAADYLFDFEELWEKRDVEKSGKGKPDPVQIDGRDVRAWFTPGHGRALSQRIATAIGSARERVRIASPVITSGPVLSTLAELARAKSRPDIAGVVDGPQVRTVFHQWSEDGHVSWKVSLLADVLGRLEFSAKPSTPWTPDSELHDFMHAKLTVADDTVFLGSFNLSRSGEENAENVLEIRDAELADRMAAFVDEIRARYPRAEAPADVPR